MSGASTKFSAADSALGYLYQVRVALLWALRRLKSGSDFVVSLETLDDVAFETTGGKPEDLLQTKHHRSRQATLTDASADLWKSIRIWFEGNATGAIPSGTALHLLTTATAPKASVAANLRAYDRDVNAALKALEATARSSTNEANTACYDVFLRATPATRRLLVDTIVVVDALPNVDDLDGNLRNEIFWVAARKDHDAFLERLEGWWFRRSLKQMASLALTDRIGAFEIEAQISDLRDQFKQDSLPVDDDLLSFALDEATKASHAGSVFVRQIEIAAAGKKRITAAIRDYYRAFEQRSRWVRADLLLVGELDAYERRLCEEWELVFEAIKDEIGADAAEDAKQKSAREVLKWAEQFFAPIRANVTEPFVTRGSLHMLADGARIGWHPDFRDRLSDLLEAKDRVA